MALFRGQCVSSSCGCERGLWLTSVCVTVRSGLCYKSRSLDKMAIAYIRRTSPRHVISRLEPMEEYIKGIQVIGDGPRFTPAMTKHNCFSGDRPLQYDGKYSRHGGGPATQGNVRP